MPEYQSKPFPVPGWWKKEGMMLSEFMHEIYRFQEVEYEYNEIEYSHDLFAGDVWIGEAGMVEVLGESAGAFGFISFFKSAPAYQFVPSMLQLVPKRVN